MLWLIALVFLGMIIWGILTWGRTVWGGDGQGFAVVFGSLGLALTALILGGITLASGEGLARLQTFYEVNNQNYATTLNQTEALLSTEKFTSQLVAGSIEKLQVASTVSERIKEWRDKVNEYNTATASMKYYDSNIWTGVLIPDEVQNMKLLRIGD